MPHPLDAILNPRSLAVIGASKEPGKRGYRAVEILLRDKYAGDIFPINPKESEILGLRCYPALDAVPQAIDVALVCTPAAMLADVIEQCGRKGVKGAIVVSGGFSETGEAGRQLEERAVETARRHGVRIVGPNMNGVVSKRHACNLTTWKDVPRGDIAVLSNSANMGHWLLTKAWAHGRMGFSTMLSVGNQADVQFHEYVASLGEDDGTRAVVAYVEGFRQGRAFLDVARMVTPRKPVVMYKAGRNAVGARMARSHSDSLAGDYAVSRGALQQAGVTLVTRMEALLPVAEALTLLPPMRSRKVGIISEGGGPITVASESLTERGLVLAPLSDATQTKIRAILPRSTTISNPVDIAVLTDPTTRNYALCARAMLEDEGIAALLFVGWFGAYGRRSAKVAEEENRVATELCAWMRELGKPIVVQSHYATVNTAALDLLRAGGVPVHQDFDVAIDCLVAAADHGQAVRRLGTTEPAPVATPRAEAAQLLSACRGRPHRALLEHESKALLACHGIPVPPQVLVTRPGELAAAPFDGRPVAMKIVSPDILHKTEAGGVRLGVQGEVGMRAAMEAILASARAYKPDADIRGVLVSPMAAPGVEIIVGVTQDPQFGPVILFGLGGVFVEVLEDVVFRALPITRADALEMLAEIRAHAVLDGVRGGPAVDKDALVQLLLSVSALCQAHPQIAELDLNPVIAHARGHTIVDARILLQD
jgi:acyl-CoA synthetase (NDP forming)